MEKQNYTPYITGWKKRLAEAEKQRRRQHRKALATAETVAQMLRQRWKAHKVYLFGSCLDVDRFRMDSDIDIAVVGLHPADFFRAWAEIEHSVDFEIDLVAWEDALPSLQERIKAEGKEIGT